MEKLREYVKEYGIELSDEQISQFSTYYEMLIEKNKVMNLTAITEKEDVMLKHFADSIVVAHYHDFFREECSLIDVGTGAGFPGIPLKIAFPNLKVTLLDSLNKRVSFLQEVIEELGLKEIQAVHFRAEDAAKKEEFREQFDVCVSRAVANLSSLSEYCLPFVKEGGHFVSYKSGEVEEELKSAKKAITVLGGTVEKTDYLNLCQKDYMRSFIDIKKISKTPKKYPRKAGLPTKEPIV